MTESDKRDHSNSRDPAPLAIDATGIVDRDTPCRRCGYNLRGLPWDGICPECASRVEVSLGELRLQYCHPDWIAQLRSDAARITICEIAAVLCAIVQVLLTVAYFSSQPSVASGIVVFDLLLLGTLSIAALSAWRLTAPLKSECPSRGTLRVVRRLRVSLIAAIVLLATALAPWWFSTLFARLPISIVFLGSLFVTYLAMIALGVTWWSQLQFSAALAARMPGSELSTRAASLATDVAVFVAVAAPFFGMFTLFLLSVASSSVVAGVAFGFLLMAVVAFTVALGLAARTIAISAEVDEGLTNCLELARKHQTDRPARRPIDARAQ